MKSLVTAAPTPPIAVDAANIQLPVGKDQEARQFAGREFRCGSTAIAATEQIRGFGTQAVKGSGTP